MLRLFEKTSDFFKLIFQTLSFTELAQSFLLMQKKIKLFSINSILWFLINSIHNFLFKFLFLNSKKLFFFFLRFHLLKHLFSYLSERMDIVINTSSIWLIEQMYTTMSFILSYSSLILGLFYYCQILPDSLLQTRRTFLLDVLSF